MGRKIKVNISPMDFQEIRGKTIEIKIERVKEKGLTPSEISRLS